MEDKLPTQKSTGRQNVIFLGDSISVGELVSPHLTWVTRISEHIHKELGERFLTINSSVNGNTTRLALERMPFDVQRYGVTVLVVQFGMNDCNVWATDDGLPRVAPAAYRANVMEIINRGITFGAKHVLLATSHPTPHRTPGPNSRISYEDRRREYSQILREIAVHAAATTLIDIEAIFDKSIAEGASERDFLMPDGIHLNVSGHQIYFDAFSRPILDALARLTDHAASSLKSSSAASKI